MFKNRNDKIEWLSLKGREQGKCVNEIFQWHWKKFAGRLLWALDQRELSFFEEWSRRKEIMSPFWWQLVRKPFGLMSAFALRIFANIVLNICPRIDFFHNSFIISQYHWPTGEWRTVWNCWNLNDGRKVVSERNDVVCNGKDWSIKPLMNTICGNVF